MPLPAIVAPLVGGAANLIGGWLNGNSQDAANKQQQEFAQQMYDRQKADNLSFWNTQNAYNSPQQQMQRLRDAGLNANLVYGNGSAVNTSGDIKSPSSQSISPRSTERGNIVNGAVGTYFDVQSRALQLDNMKAHNTVLAEEALLKASQRHATDANNPLLNGLMPYTLEGRQRQNENTLWDTNLKQFTAQRNDAQAPYLKQMARTQLETMLSNLANQKQSGSNMRTNQQGVELQNKLRQLEITLNENGISKSDPIYFRVLGRLLNSFGIKL